MTGGSLSADVKRTSVLRRVPPLEEIRFRPKRAGEGDVCAFELPRDGFPIVAESSTGRVMTIAPGDAFLATPGYRQARIWAVGSIPAGGLVPGNDYWMLSDSGMVGELISYSALEMGHLGRVRYLGAVCGGRGETLNIRQFGVTGSGGADRNAPVYLILGTSSEVGKTTAGVAVLRSLRMKGHATVVALKATGTPSIAEIARYQDFGARAGARLRRFRLPSTYPVGREGSRTSSVRCSISASRCRPMPWWWNAPAIRSLPTHPSFLMSQSATLRSQDNPGCSRCPRRDGRKASACGNRARDQSDNGPVHRYANPARMDRGAVRYPRDKPAPQPRPENPSGFARR